MNTGWGNTVSHESRWKDIREEIDKHGKAECVRTWDGLKLATPMDRIIAMRDKNRPLTIINAADLEKV
jgi:hypothetical protein